MAEGIDFVAGRFLDVVRDLDATTTERDVLRAEVEQLRSAVHRVEALLAHARLVSPSAAMTVYAADVEAAIAGTTSPTQPSTETK